MICFKYTERFIVCSAAYNNRIWVTPFHTVIINIIDSVILNFSNLEFDIITLVIFLHGCVTCCFLDLCASSVDYRHQQYNHIPGSKRTSFFHGNASELRDNKGRLLCEILLDHALTYGPVFVWWYFFSPLVVISSPEFIKHGIVTLNLPKAPSTYVTV